MAKKNTAKNKIVRIKGIGNPNAFTPWKPSLPPAGLYDPVIDANLGSAQRGYRYLTGDQSGVQGLGSYDTGDLDVAQRRSQEDIGVGLEGLARTRSRGLDDNASQLAGLERSYGQMANRQTGAMRKMGLMDGGAMQEASTRRAANMAYDRKPIDTQRGRIMQDYGDPSVANDYGNQGAAMQLAARRALEDRNTQAGRATTEVGAFEQGSMNSAWAQAMQANPSLLAPARPAGEQQVGNQTYRLYRAKAGSRKGQLLKRLPSGRLVARSDMSSLM